MTSAIRVVDTIEEMSSSFTANQFAQWNGSAFAGAAAVVDSFHNPLAPYSRVFLSQLNLGNGNTTFSPDIPSGYTLFFPRLIFGNPTVGSITVTVSLTRAGTTYQASDSQAITAGLTSTSGTAYFALVTGDEVVVNMSAAGANVGAVGYLIPTTADVKVITTPLVNGNNVIYTCPAGKQAYMTGWDNVSGSLSVQMLIRNSSGGTRVYSVFAVPSGGAADSTTKIAYRSVPNNLMSSLFVAPVQLTAGGTFVVNTDGSGNQVLSYVIVEIPV